MKPPSKADAISSGVSKPEAKPRSNGGRKPATADRPDYRGAIKTMSEAKLRNLLAQPGFIKALNKTDKEDVIKRLVAEPSLSPEFEDFVAEQLANDPRYKRSTKRFEELLVKLGRTK
ncbi:MAG: hypothetical protein HRF49_10885 [bacterium]|jgi:hypothetical protein